MSPARSKRQAPIPHRRSRADIVKAVAVAAGIVLGTSLFIWLMRPGPAGIPATGGLMNRQPRSSWLVGTAIGVAGLTTWLTFRSRRTRNRVKVVLPIELGVVAVVAIVGGIMWPGGLLRHDVAPKPTPTTTPKPGQETSTSAGAPTSTSPSSLPFTGGTGGTGGRGGTATTTATGTTATTSASSTTTKGP